MAAAFVAGFSLGLGLIVAIGAQNAFVLRQGLRRAHVLRRLPGLRAVGRGADRRGGRWAAARSSTAAPWIAVAARWGGAAFLPAYGAFGLVRAPGGAASGWRRGRAPARSAAALATCLALHLAEPARLSRHGGAARLGVGGVRGAAAAFAAGAVAASFVFFFALGYGARLLRPVFARPGAWRVLDLGIALRHVGHRRAAGRGLWRLWRPAPLVSGRAHDRG